MFSFSIMDIAIDAAKRASTAEEVPVGAVIAIGNEIISVAYNRVIEMHDPTAHAEVLAIRDACQKLKTCMLTDCQMYVTLEPCAMCTKAILLSRIKKIYFGAYNFKTGAIFHGENMLYSKQNILEVIGGVKERECSDVLRDFFMARRS